MYMLDVYSGNGKIDWHQVSGRGFTLAYLKASQGGFKDPQIEHNIAGCSEANVRWGAYHFVDPISAVTQWSTFWEFSRASWLPPVLDVERKEGVEAGLVWAAAGYMLEKVLAQGRIPMIYTNKDMADALLKLPSLAKKMACCPLWYAAYHADRSQAPIPDAPAPWRWHWAWQYTDRAAIPGTQGDVDVSLLSDPFIRWLNIGR